MKRLPFALHAALLILLCGILAACGPSSEPASEAASGPGSAAEAASTATAPAEAADPSGSAGLITRKYDWYLERVTPAGNTTITRSPDDRITSEAFMHWNNR